MKTFREYQSNYDYYDGYNDEESAAVSEIYSLSSLSYERFEDAFDSLSEDQFKILLSVYNEYLIERRRN